MKLILRKDTGAVEAAVGDDADVRDSRKPGRFDVREKTDRDPNNPWELRLGGANLARLEVIENAPDIPENLRGALGRGELRYTGKTGAYTSKAAATRS